MNVNAINACTLELLWPLCFNLIVQRIDRSTQREVKHWIPETSCSSSQGDQSQIWSCTPRVRSNGNKTLPSVVLIECDVDTQRAWDPVGKNSPCTNKLLVSSTKMLIACITTFSAAYLPGLRTSQVLELWHSYAVSAKVT